MMIVSIGQPNQPTNATKVLWSVMIDCRDPPPAVIWFTAAQGRLYANIFKGVWSLPFPPFFSVSSPLEVSPLKYS